MRSIALILSAVLAAPLLPAQHIVSPRGLTNAYGGIDNSIPWGGFQSPEQFYQQVHDDLLGRTLEIQGMAFRHAWNANYAPRSYIATLTLGEAANKATKTSTSFASNWRSAGSKTQVLNGTISFPSFPPYSSPPAPFDAPISFTTPYAYNGKYTLMWEVHITWNSANTPTHYFEGGPGSSHQPAVLGKGCTVTGQTAPLISSGGISTTAWAEKLLNGPATGLALIAIGDTADKWSGQTLPFSLLLAGSPACSININILTYVPPTTTWLFARPYKWHPGLAGIRVRSQWAITDQGFIRTSNGLDHSFPYANGTTSAWPTARVWANSFGTSLPTTGTLDANGLVTQFRQ